MLYPLSHALAPPCLPAVRLACRPISSPVVSIVVSQLFDTVGRGVRREASVLSACLASSCDLYRCLPMSIVGSFRFHPLRCHLSACLLCRLGCVGDRVLISSCGMYCDVLLACGSYRLSPRSSSRRSGRFCVSLPVFRHGGRGGGCGAIAVCYRSSF